MTYDDLLSLLCSSEDVSLVLEHDQALEKPINSSFFIKPDLKESINLDKSPFMIISAPGATGKSTFGYNLGKDKNAFYWNLSKANIGDNYFIGTLSKSFGGKNLSTILDLINNGRILFIIDAFDEAEISCGWDRISSFIKEMVSYSNSQNLVSFILLARYETAQYLSLLLDEYVGENKYYYLEIQFFKREQAQLFLYEYLKDKDFRYQLQKEKLLQVSDVIFNGIEKVMSSKHEVAYRTKFYGYAPVLQAIATLISQYQNLQELENDYKDNSKYDEITGQIISHILEREKNKVISSLRTRLSNKGLPLVSIEKFYSSEEQVVRLINYTNKRKVNTEDYDITHANGKVLDEYHEAIKEFLPQHPFLINSNEFSSPAFKDYAYSLALAKQLIPVFAINISTQFFSTITPLFWQFYLMNRTDESIEGEHVGLICESFISGKTNGEDVITAVFDQDDKTEMSTIIQLEDIIESKIVNLKILSDTIVFPYVLKNIFIKTNKKLVLGSKGSDFYIINSTINADDIEFLSEKIIIRCDDFDKPITIYSKNEVVYNYNLKLEKIGLGVFVINWPYGQKHPWSEFYKELAETEEKNIDNLLLSLRQILKWFRKDKRDSIARYADFIENVAVNGNKLNRRMVDYLLEKNVLWRDGGLYKLSHKVAEKKGINFSSMKNMTCNDQLKEFLLGFN